MLSIYFVKKNLLLRRFHLFWLFLDNIISFVLLYVLLFTYFEYSWYKINFKYITYMQFTKINTMSLKIKWQSCLQDAHFVRNCFKLICVSFKQRNWNCDALSGFYYVIYIGYVVVAQFFKQNCTVLVLIGFDLKLKQRILLNLCFTGLKVIKLAKQNNRTWENKRNKLSLATKGCFTICWKLIYPPS